MSTPSRPHRAQHDSGDDRGRLVDETLADLRRIRSD
jgi:hypothetical protein